MRLRDLLRPRQIAYLGPRTLAAMLALLGLGIAFYLVGGWMSDRTVKGVGVLFAFIGLVWTVALFLRWLMLRKIG